MDSKPKFLSAAVATVAAAALFYFGTGLSPIAALSWFAPLPLLWLAPRVRAWACGLTSFLAYLVGTTNSWPWYFESIDMPFWPLGLPVSLAISALFAAGVLLFRALLLRGRAWWSVMALPAMWTTAMFLIEHLNPMGLVDPMGTPQVDYPPLMQLAGITGGWGVSFVVLAVPTAIAAATAPGVATPKRWTAAVTGVVIVAVTLGIGALQLSRSNDDDTRRVALLAHNTAGWGLEPDKADGRRLLDEYLDGIDGLDDGVDDVVLPEGVFTGTRDELRPVVRALRDKAAEDEVNIVIGMVVLEGGERLQTGWTFSPAQQDPPVYQKFHDRVGPPGDELVFPLEDDSRVAVQVCGDLAFTQPSRAYGRAGAGIILSPASTEDVNGKLLSSTGVLRGVENGYAMAWSSRQGVLSLSDPQGRILAEKHTGDEPGFTSVTADVPIGDGGTWYARWGDWFAWMAVALTLTAVALSFVKSRTRVSRGEPARPRDPVA